MARSFMVSFIAFFTSMFCGFGCETQGSVSAPDVAQVIEFDASQTDVGNDIGNEVSDQFFLPTDVSVMIFDLKDLGVSDTTSGRPDGLPDSTQLADVFPLPPEVDAFVSEADLAYEQDATVDATIDATQEVLADVGVVTDQFVNPPPAQPTCEVVEVEQGGRCFNGCDDDLDGLLDTLDPSCAGSCDKLDPFCEEGLVCNDLTEMCEEPIPLEALYPDPGACDLMEEDHPCHNLCVGIVSIGETCFWSGGAVVAVKDVDADRVQDELVVLDLPVDNCTAWPNANQADTDGNGVGDWCELSAEEQQDTDHDLVPDGVDNCRWFYNPWQLDADLDGIADECELMPAEGCEDGLLETEDRWNPDMVWCEHRALVSLWHFWIHLCGFDRSGACGACNPPPQELETSVVYEGWACTVYPDQDGDGVPELGEGINAQYLDEPFVDQQ